MNKYGFQTIICLHLVFRLQFCLVPMSPHVLRFENGSDFYTTHHNCRRVVWVFCSCGHKQVLILTGLCYALVDLLLTDYYRQCGMKQFLFCFVQFFATLLLSSPNFQCFFSYLIFFACVFSYFNYRSKTALVYINC